VLEGLDRVPWDTYPQPEWNRPGEVPAALRALASAKSKDPKWDVYNRLLFAIGNNHAGTCCAVAVCVVPFLGEILLDGGPYARMETLDILLDVLCFGPEPEDATVPAADGSPIPLREALDAAIAAMWREVGPVVAARASDPGEVERAKDLAERIADLEKPG
jgi:hypothetical protein